MPTQEYSIEQIRQGISQCFVSGIMSCCLRFYYYLYYFTYVSLLFYCFCLFSLLNVHLPFQQRARKIKWSSNSNLSTQSFGVFLCLPLHFASTTHLFTSLECSNILRIAESILFLLVTLNTCNNYCFLPLCIIFEKLELA